MAFDEVVLQQLGLVGGRANKTLQRVKKAFASINALAEFIAAEQARGG